MFVRIWGMVENVKGLAKKSFESLRNDGIKGFFVKARNWTVFTINKKRIKQNVKDILLINGCSISYCERYRVTHKIEELEAFGITCDSISSGMVADDLIGRYRGFIIYRAPYTKELEDFVRKAQKYNKVVFYDIDDLVFDLKYTEEIESLKKLPKDELDLYNDGVVRFGKMMDCCDCCTTSTRVIMEEMKKRGKDVCIDRNIASLEMQAYSDKAIVNVKRDNSKVVIGYASGSLTHNEDFELIKPALKRILKEYKNVQLKLVGALDIPGDLEEFRSQILTSPFVDYKKLPTVIRSFDINIAPLKNTFFNSAKSSIKWMEAGLVKVPTIASDVGDFRDSITDGVNGVLCKDNQWYKKIKELIEDETLRLNVAEGAYTTVKNEYTSIQSGKVLSDFILKKLHKNIYFVLPGVTTSGGILVATKHAEILMKNGFDVTMLNLNEGTEDIKYLKCGDNKINVLPYGKIDCTQHVDEMVATMWLTLPIVLNYPFCSDKRYLVQGKESNFYELPDKRILEANATYCNSGIKYVTISKWCKSWLEKTFGKKVNYAPNGIDLSEFPLKERKMNGKIKILIEGDPGSYYKNVDEAFKITNRLDRKRYEVYFSSYDKEPKKWYRYDKFYNNINHNEMYKVYQSADILLKTSLLESFSYPPLEMMATGGYCVVRPNEGNVEYLKDNYNCLFYKPGDIDDAIEKIDRIANDAELRKKLSANSLKTIESREWDKVEDKILELYS